LWEYAVPHALEVDICQFLPSLCPELNICTDARDALTNLLQAQADDLPCLMALVQ